ncbi:MAG TPA: hypothetical protein V6C52_08050 [Coleofasciculaceae cyanobacterium]|jgi:hypothetical protein
MKINRFSMPALRFGGNDNKKATTGVPHKIEIQGDEDETEAVAIPVKQGDTVKFVWNKPSVEDFESPPPTLH